MWLPTREEGEGASWRCGLMWKLPLREGALRLLPQRCPLSLLNLHQTEDPGAEKHNGTMLSPQNTKYLGGKNLLPRS